MSELNTGLSRAKVSAMSWGYVGIYRTYTREATLDVLDMRSRVETAASFSELIADLVANEISG